MSVFVTAQVVQEGHSANNPEARVLAQVVQVAKGFSLKTITVQTQSYPKDNPVSFFSRSGSKSITVGPNSVRVTEQVLQIARLVVPN